MQTSDILKINVNDHTEKKGNLTYLSWAWAWSKALEIDPKASFFVEMFGDKCYMDINGSAMVMVSVTLNEQTRCCQLPVMDNRNRAIIAPDAFAVNTAIMRCMTKALSLHGLGLYIYAGEDLPQGEEPESTVDESKLLDYMAAFDEVNNMVELKKLYIEAFAACDGDKTWQKKVIEKKNAIKGKLQ